MEAEGGLRLLLKLTISGALAVLVAQPTAIAKVDPYANPGGPYERLLDCYAAFMEAKGFDFETDEVKVHRWDAAAKVRCRKEYRSLERALGPRKTRSEWRDLWTEYWSRL